jgi:pyruvate/2-oxoglutarate dehydrogenase complex dihydrolipoamide acyltransferase (E2) component
MADGPVNSNYTDIPNSNMRGIIASRLTDSRATVPHFFTSIECEIDELLALRQTLKKVTHPLSNPNVHLNTEAVILNKT